jgi:hypothetical protein
MTGEVLYIMHAKFASARGVQMDKWSDLDQMDRDIWNDTAEWIASTGD